MNEPLYAPVTLEQILSAREARAQRQQALQRRFRCPIISFTMNIPGPTKDSPLIRFAFRAALRRLHEQLGDPLHREYLYQNTGCEALLVYDHEADALKSVCIALEEDTAVGRLYDLDVLNEQGEKLSRSKGRTCLICGGPVSVCSRSRAHGLPALEARTGELLRDFAAGQLAALAEEALLAEVAFTPKPGLVDQRNNGAHHDMDLLMFVRSAGALRPHFRRFAELGMAGVTPELLRTEGKLAEQTMLHVTGGINTHKGAIYSLSLLLSATGTSLVRGGNIFQLSASAAAALSPPEGTNGSAVRQKYGIGGVREEAISAFPTLRRCRQVLEQEGPLAALLWSMAHLEDTNLYHRGGAEGAAYVRHAAEEILAAPAAERETLAIRLDDELTRRNLSGGGSADILALALFLQSLCDFLEPYTLR